MTAAVRAKLDSRIAFCLSELRILSNGLRSNNRNEAATFIDGACACVGSAKDNVAILNRAMDSDPREIRACQNR